jgi:transposase-like protein
MPGSGSEKRQITGKVLVRVTAEQQAAVARHALAEQVTMATWLRQLIADALDVDPGPVVIRAQAPELVLEVAHLREVVAELSGALVQAAVAARKDGRAVEHAEIEALIPRIKSAALELDKVKEKLWPRAR